MTKDRFNLVPALELSRTKQVGMTADACLMSLVNTYVSFDLTVAEAAQLRDWLNKALGSYPADEPEQKT